VAYLRERDPAHMAYIDLFPTYASNEQLGTSGDQVTAYREHLRQFIDVVRPRLLSYDHYQFATDGDIDGYFLNLAMVRAAAQEAKIRSGESRTRGEPGLQTGTHHDAHWTRAAGVI
jgi:hypothetical protein